MTTSHSVLCHLCEATCGLRVELAEGRIREIRGNPEEPLSRGSPVRS